MTNAAWATYLAAVAASSGYFLFAKRRFDFLSIAFIGAIFYFSPLFWGWVLQADQRLTDRVQPTVYLIAAAYLMALVMAGFLSDYLGAESEPSTKPGKRGLSVLYLLIAVGGLVVSLASTRGAIINIDKAVVLSQVGYAHILFEVAASLTCISATIERRPWALACGFLLLVIDLLIGFRVFFMLAVLSVALVLLAREGRVQLYKKIPKYGSGVVVLLVAMLLVNATRATILYQVEKFQADRAERVSGGAPLGHRQLPPAPTLGAPDPTAKPLDPLSFSSWAALAYRVVSQSGEPFVVQATLVAIVETGLTCKPSNILKSVYLLVPPGMGRFVPINSYPPTFYDEYQPILYPNITYGTGGNIWAEMLCRFGYVGLAIFGVVLILTLIGLNRLYLRSSPALASLVALCGITLAFYMHRNDLHFTLQMIKWNILVFVAASVLSVAATGVRNVQAKPG